MGKTLVIKVAAFLCAISIISGCSVMKKDAKPTSNSVLAAKAEGKQCVDNFELLRQLNYDSFNHYKTQFDEINRGYDYYKARQGLMESDPKELITFTLNDKLNMICERVKSQTFVEIRKKMQAISKI